MWAGGQGALFIGILAPKCQCNIAQWATMHSGRVPYCCLDGAICTDLYKYLCILLKNIFMLTKIFEETLPWLVKILKTDQQWRSLWTSIPISMDLLRPQCNTRRPQCNTRHPQCNVCMSKCQQRWTLECWAALTTTTALLAFIIMPELSNVLLVNVDFIKTILSCRCYNACTFHVNKTMYGAKLSLYYHYRNSSDGS